ncbi:MAG: transposase [Cyanobacteria bacterium J06627_3]
MLSEIVQRFAQESPISVMMRGAMELVFRPERLDDIFERHAKVQYQRELLFSSVVNLLSLVVCGIHPSMNAAYRKKAEEMNVTRNAVYEKLNGIEPQVSRAVLKETAAELSALMDTMGGKSESLLAGYEIRILDGNGLAATERRLKVLREVASSPLPGKSLVVLDPERRLAVDIFPCEDGHAQERRLFGQVLNGVRSGEVWVADRNMCTQEFLVEIAQREAVFVIREHQNLPYQTLSDLTFIETMDAGEIFEQDIEIQYNGHRIDVRRVVLRLATPTRHGDTDIVVLTNLPTATADASTSLRLYRNRWRVEGLFLTVTMNFEGEIKTLAYPKAALFSFTLALVAYNILAIIKGALASVYGVETSEETVSDFYVVDELQGVYRGMMIAIPPEHWQSFQELSLIAMAAQLKALANQVNLKQFRKQPRKPKTKKKKPLVRDPKKPHVATARLLSDQ